MTLAQIDTIAIPVSAVFVFILSLVLFQPLPLEGLTSIMSSGVMLFFVFMVAITLWLVDRHQQKRLDAAEHELHDILQDIGEAATEGFGLESAIVRAANQRSGITGKRFQNIIAAAKQHSIERAIQIESEASQDPKFIEAARLLSVAIAAGGDIGRIIKELGARMARDYALKRQCQTYYRNDVLYLRLFGVVVFPFLLSLVAGVTNFDLGAIGTRFFFGVNVALFMLEVQLLNGWRGPMARQPFYLVTIFSIMHFMAA